MIPHGREIVPDERGFLRLNPNIPMESVRRTMTGRSRVKTSGETSLNGDIVPLVPTTVSELKKFEPIMLPSVSSFCPRRAEAMADASSGSEVPAAMTVSPISNSETPNERASPTAPQTRMCDDATSSARPPTSARQGWRHEGASSAEEGKAMPPTSTLLFPFLSM